MIRIVALFTFLLLCGCSGQSESSSDLTFDFLKADGGSVALLDNEKSSVVMFLSPDCPLCHSYSLSFNQLREKFGDTINFYGILAGDLYDQEEIDHFVDSFDFAAPIILDPDLELASTLEAEVTPQVFLLNKDGWVMYDGKVDNWAISLGRKKLKADSLYLQWAIEQHLSGEDIQISKTKPVGCVIEY